MNYAVLKAELVNDPLGRGYGGMSDAQIVASLLTKNRTRERPTLQGGEIYEAVDASEFAAKTAVQQQEVWSIIHMGMVYVASGKRARARLIAIFGAGSQTIGNLAALVNESISRAEELGIADVAEGHIQKARVFGG